MINQQISSLCRELNLGIIKEIEPVSGGLLHKMFKVNTQSGCYAIKALNPKIMMRDTAYHHTVYSEKVANIAKNNNVNALPALTFNNQSIIKHKENYYLVFEWFDGKPVNTGTIDITKSKIVGELLADIHNTDFSMIDYHCELNDDYSLTDWQGLIDLAIGKKLAWPSQALAGEVFNLLQKKSFESLRELNKTQVVSHRDLDQKNIMWNDNIALVIDWESAGNVNPMLELMEVALYWSTDVDKKVHEQSFKKVLSAYKSKREITKDIITSLYAVFNGKLAWLEYNMKRSLGLESSDVDEQILGTQEVQSTANSIMQFNKNIKKIINWLQEYK